MHEEALQRMRQRFIDRLGEHGYQADVLAKTAMEALTDHGLFIVDKKAIVDHTRMHSFIRVTADVFEQNDMHRSATHLRTLLNDIPERIDE